MHQVPFTQSQVPVRQSNIQRSLSPGQQQQQRPQSFTGYPASTQQFQSIPQQQQFQQQPLASPVMVGSKVTPIVRPIVQQSNQYATQLQQATEEEDDEEYEALKIPPNWKEAEEHAESRKTGEIHDIPHHERKFCKCCGYQVQRKQLEFDTHHPGDMKFLGSGFPLFYNFIKYCMAILIFFIAISGVYNLYTNNLGHFCSKIDVLKLSNHPVVIDIEAEMKICHHNFAHQFAVVNKINSEWEGQKYNTGDEYMPTQHILNLFVAGTVMIILMFFRRSQRKIDCEIDDAQCTPSDFTVIVKNIPRGLDCDYEKELRHIFTHNVVRDPQGQEMQMNVTKVNLVYKIDHIIELEEQIKEVVTKKQAHLRHNQSTFRNAFIKGDPVLEDWDKEIEHLEHRIHTIENKIPEDQAHYFQGTAFVSFKTEQEKDMVVDQNTHTFWEQVSSFSNGGELKNISDDDLTWENNKLFVEEAPEPDDIDWEFIHVSTGKKIRARILAWVKTILFLALCYSAIWGLTKYQGYVIEQSYEELGEGDLTLFNWYTVKFMTFVISMSIVLFNKFVLGKVFHMIVDEEYYSTKTKFNVAFAFKLTIGLFVNSALLAYFVEILGEQNFYGPGGFIYTETWVFIWNALLPPTVWLLDPWTIQKDGWRKKALEDSRKGVCFLTQDEANKLMEKVEYTQGKRYADIMKTMWFTFFYAPAIPLGLLFSLLNLVYYYYIDQYNVMKRRTIKETLSKDVSIEMIENLELSIVFYAIGNITFSYMLFQDVDPLGWVLLGAAILYALLPMQEINEFFFPIERTPEAKTYEEAELVFITDYDQQNPITKKAAIKRYRQMMRQDIQNQKQQVKPVFNQQPMFQSGAPATQFAQSQFPVQNSQRFVQNLPSQNVVYQQF